MAGRPRAWNVVSDIDAAVWTEALQPGADGRVTLPARVRTFASWLSGGEGLAILKPNYSADLLDLSGQGAVAVADIEEALRNSNGIERDEIALYAMDCFCRVRVDTDGRLSLPQGLRSHLQTDRRMPVRLVANRSSISLWSEREWAARRRERFEHLSKRLQKQSQSNNTWLRT